MLYCLTMNVNLILVFQILLKYEINITFYQNYAKIHIQGQTFIVAQYGNLYLLNL